MANNLENTLQIEKALKQLKNSYDMYEKSKKEAEKRLKEALNSDGTKRYTPEEIKNNIDLINTAQSDVVDQYLMLGGNEADLKKKTSRKKTLNSNTSKDILEIMQEMKVETDNNIPIPMVEDKMGYEYIPAKGDYNPEAAFDVIPLPSKGEGYKEKVSKASVAYLTAYDENMIVSPNLYRDNLILDYILQEKVLSKEVEPIDLLEGDREAIILFLRANGYGNEYPITAVDDATGKEFEAIVDLSKLKYKEFNLKGDSNGWFSFKLPVCGKEVKFRFPTHRDIVLLEKMEQSEENKMKKTIISNYTSTLDTFIETENELTKDDKVKVRQAIRTIENWGDRMEEENSLKYKHTLTNKLNLLVMAVDGITDKKYIYDFIRKMPVKDSHALRKYMTDNEPGIDYNIEIERPESLGGGSVKTFLQFDQFLFLNIA